MSRKNQLNYKIEDNRSLAASFISSPTVIKYLDNVSYQINITTSAASGFFTIQASNDYEVNEPGTQIMDSGVWTDLTLSGVPVVAGANDSIVISMNQVPYNALRIQYTSTVAGAGTCDIITQIKQIGG